MTSYPCSSINEPKNGFTLIELAIVMVIIGFIAGAVMGGVALKRTLALKTMMDEMSQLTQAYGNFITKYQVVPGDAHNAVTLFGAGNTSNGDGNNLIDTAAEQSLAFQHLALAGMIRGNYTATWATTPSNTYSIANSKYYFWNGPVWGATTQQNYLNAVVALDVNANGTLSGNTELYRSIVSPSEMAKMDKKFDDGAPTTGLIIAGDGYDAAANSCVNTGAYVATSTTISCIFAIQIDKTF